MNADLTPAARYHVPRSQVWAGSRGGQRGKVHLHLGPTTTALCGRPAWWDRAPEGEQELVPEARCPRCVARAERQGIAWPC